MRHQDDAGREAMRLRPVFVFSGQGSQWLEMGRELLEHSTVFEMVLRACDTQVRRHLGWSLLEAVTARTAPLGDIEVSCPAIVAMELGLAALWRSWGVEPAAVMGHSIGEVAAAHVAGVLSLEDAMRVICQQGRTMGCLRGRGAMAVVGMSWARAGEIPVGLEGRLWRVVHASPEWTVVAGEPEALERALRVWRGQGVVARRVDSEVAAHCPQVEPFAADLRERLLGLRPRPERLPFFSTVTGDEVGVRRLDAEHWVRNLTEPVLFREAADAMISRGHEVFLEISPHPLVKHWLESSLEHAGRRGTVLASMRRGREPTQELLETLRQLSEPPPPLCRPRASFRLVESPAEGGPQ
ncbi:MAG: acyltransferase domain-containing protein [Cystobacter sp.]